MARGLYVARYAQKGYQKITVYITREAYERLVLYAVRNRMNISDAVNKLIMDCIRDNT